MCSLATHPTGMCIKPPTQLDPSHSEREGSCSPAAELNVPSKHAIAQRKQRTLRHMS